MQVAAMAAAAPSTGASNGAPAASETLSVHVGIRVRRDDRVDKSVWKVSGGTELQVRDMKAGSRSRLSARRASMKPKGMAGASTASARRASVASTGLNSSRDHSGMKFSYVVTALLAHSTAGTHPGMLHGCVRQL